MSLKGSTSKAQGNALGLRKRNHHPIMFPCVSALKGRTRRCTMAQSLARILVHIIFSTKERMPVLARGVRPQLAAYLAGIGKRIA